MARHRGRHRRPPDRRAAAARVAVAAVVGVALALFASTAVTAPAAPDLADALPIAPSPTPAGPVSTMAPGPLASRTTATTRRALVDTLAAADAAAPTTARPQPATTTQGPRTTTPRTSTPTAPRSSATTTPRSSAPAPAACPTVLAGTRPHVAAVGHRVARRFGLPLSSVLGYRPTAVDADGHPAGLALDFMVPPLVGDRVAAYVLANLDALNARYVIWRQRYNDGRGWSVMADRGGATANHMDHVHVSFDGAATGGPLTC